MDDFIILYHDKAALRRMLLDIADFLKNKLRLQLNQKTQIFPLGPRCIDFLGYRIHPTHRLLRKGNVRRTKRKLRKYSRLYAERAIDLDQITPSVMSWLGHAQHADTYRLCNTMLPAITFVRRARI
jgi:hypothetical protein